MKSKKSASAQATRKCCLDLRVANPSNAPGRQSGKSGPKGMGVSVEREEQEAAHRAGAHTVTMSCDRAASPLSGFGGENDQSEPDSDNNDSDNKDLFSLALLDGDANADIESGLSAENDDQDSMILSITVADSGIGIPSERLKMIFEPYTQAKLSDFRQHGGTGTYAML